MTPFKQIKAFYLEHLPDSQVAGQTITAPCPFCSRSGDAALGKIVIYINPESYFRGYFKC